MPERWERRLQTLKEVDAPASIPARVEQGPRGHADPGPSVGKRAVTIVVAFAVFAAAGVFAWRAFDRPVTSVVGPPTELPVFRVRFERAGVIDDAPDSPMIRVDTVFDYGDAHQKDFTSTIGENAVVDYVGVQSLTAFVPGPTAGSPVSIMTDGTDAEVLIGSPEDWPSFERFEAIDRLPQEPGDYILVFQASYPEGIARTARRVSVVEPGALQLAFDEGGEAFTDPSGSLFVDGRETSGLRTGRFAGTTDHDRFQRQPWLPVSVGAAISVATPIDRASGAVVGSFEETPLELPIDLSAPGAMPNGPPGQEYLAVEVSWTHGDQALPEGTRMTALFFFRIEVTEGGSSSVVPDVVDGPTVVVEFHVGDLNGAGASGTLTSAGHTIDGTVGSYCWTFEGGGGCGDAVAPSFVPGDFLDVEVGSTLVFEGDASSVSGELDLAGDYPFERVEDLSDLVSFDLAPGWYVLAVVAHADQGDVPFYFPIRLVTSASEGGPTAASPVDSATVIPDVAGLTELDAYDMLRSLGFIPVASYLPFYDVPAGIVAETQPPAGTGVDPNTTVNMTVQGSTRDNDYSGSSWVDAAIAGDDRYIGSFADPGGIPVAVVSSRTRAEVHGDLAAIAGGRPFFTLVCASVTRQDLDATLRELHDPVATPVAATVDARMFVDPASCAVAIDERDVSRSQGSLLVSTYGELIAIEDLRGVQVATRV